MSILATYAAACPRLAEKVWACSHSEFDDALRGPSYLQYRLQRHSYRLGLRCNEHAPPMPPVRGLNEQERIEALYTGFGSQIACAVGDSCAEDHIELSHLAAEAAHHTATEAFPEYIMHRPIFRGLLLDMETSRSGGGEETVRRGARAMCEMNSSSASSSAQDVRSGDVQLNSKASVDPASMLKLKAAHLNKPNAGGALGAALESGDATMEKRFFDFRRGENPTTICKSLFGFSPNEEVLAHSTSAAVKAGLAGGFIGGLLSGGLAAVMGKEREQVAWDTVLGVAQGSTTAAASSFVSTCIAETTGDAALGAGAGVIVGATVGMAWQMERCTRYSDEDKRYHCMDVALGSAAGGVAGTLLGQALIPVPVVGGFVGGMAGRVIGAVGLS